jgi:endonuclease YncB( thermonuclease family)
MILVPRLLSARRSSAALVLAALTFVMGLSVGASVGPVTASRSDPVAAPVTPVVPAEPIPTWRAAHSAEVLRVLDGDTFEARVHLWPGLNITTRVRLRGIDAPELNARCMDERIKAEAARDALRAMLDRGEVGIMRVSLDKYGGRVLADASAFSIPDVAASLLNTGHVRRYSGARRETWCLKPRGRLDSSASR